MSTNGYIMGYLMLIGGIALCLLGVDQRDGGMATAGAILISSTWFGFFVIKQRKSGDQNLYQSEKSDDFSGDRVAHFWTHAPRERR